MPISLETRWLDFWAKCLGRDDDLIVRLYFLDLAEHYYRTEGRRHYHTLDHLRQMFEEFDEIKSCLNNPNAVELAIWYHDIVYDSRKHDNEAQSAEFFRSLAEKPHLKFHLTELFIRQVVEMILATRHTAVSNIPDIQFLCDIDLSILGQSEEVFDEYERQIRQEYSWVSEIDFAKGRSAVLQSFLDRPHIYSTMFFREKYEDQARKNLTRSIAQLSGRLQS